MDLFWYLPPMNLRISASGLVKSHLAGRRPHPALMAVDLQWESDTLVVLTGANGAGKTTLLRLLGGLDVPDAGQILLQGQRLLPASTPQQLRALTAWLPDRPTFPAHMPACQVMEESLILDGVPARERESRLDAAVRRFDLEAFWRRPGAQASRGQQAQLSLAMLSLLDRRAWWLDEPFAALDTPAIDRTCAWIETRVAANQLVVLCTHQADGGPALAKKWSVPVAHWSLANGKLSKSEASA
jgi:ABC-type multidrug transport system ATPase subunit